MTAEPLLQRFQQGLGAAEAGPGPFDVLGIAVSGGSDSLALLHLAVAAGRRCHAVTVDHGLRPEAAEEAAMVARVCAGLGVPHQVLQWRWDGQGNLADQARRGRYGVMAGWAHRQGIAAIALGHTRDDVAETFVMRLARQAGVDGLAAMQARRRHQGVVWLRPCLRLGRQDLRTWLSAQGISWADDPGNDNPAYDRARVRQALAGLAPLGLDVATLAAVAHQLSDVRDALDLQVDDAARRFARLDAGDVLIATEALATLPAEVLRRLVLRAVLWVSSAEYGPRGAAMGRALAALRGGQPVTLHGCRMVPGTKALRIFREWQAVRSEMVPLGQAWDRRWKVSGPEINGLHIQALGADGLALCPGWRDTGRSWASLLASPSVWRGGELVAAPLAGHAHGWHAATIPPDEAFFLSGLSH